MPKTNYRRLREEDRHVIQRMRKAGKTQKEIAEALGFCQSSVCRELSRNRGGRGYRAKQAEDFAAERRKLKKTRAPAIHGEVEEEVLKRLELKRSPDQVSSAMRLEGFGPSRETIYQYVLRDKRNGGSLHLNLRINGKRRYRRRSKSSREKIPNRVGIELRPASVANRSRYGDWEVDLIVGSGGSGYLLSLYERKSRTGLLMKLSSKGAEETAAGIVSMLEGFKVRSLTYDNGLEFARHEEVSARLGSKAYFCQPYHSWEKGGVENFNGLVRQYMPKKSDFGNYDHAAVAAIEQEINQRPKKVLGFRTPASLRSKIAA